MFKALQLIIGNFVALLRPLHWQYGIPRDVGCRESLVEHFGQNG